MSQAKGYASVLQVGAEAVAYGTKAASLASIPIISHTLKPKQAQAVPEVIGIGRDAPEPQDFEKGAEGDVVVPLDGVSFATWLDTVFDTGIRKDVQGSLSLQDPIASVKANQYLGMKIARMAFSFKKGQQPRCTISLVGAGGTAETAIVPVAITAFKPFLSHQLAITLDETPVTNFTGFDLTIDFGLAAGSDFVISGGATRVCLSEGEIAVTGTITALFDDAALQTLAIARTTFALGWTLTNDEYILTCTLAEVKAGDFTQDLPGPGGRFISIPFTAFWAADAANSSVQLSIAAVV